MVGRSIKGLIHYLKSLLERLINILPYPGHMSFIGLLIFSVKFILLSNPKASSTRDFIFIIIVCTYFHKLFFVSIDYSNSIILVAKE